MLRNRDNSTNALMSLDFSKRSYRKILERIIPQPSGGRGKLRYARFQRVSLNPPQSHFIKGEVKMVIFYFYSPPFLKEG